MSFQDYLQNSGAANRWTGSFTHSSRALPQFDNPTPEQKQEIAAAAREIAAEIGAAFDAARQPVEQEINAILAQLNGYYSAPVPWGVPPQAPPLSLFQAYVMGLVRLNSIATAFQPDADGLAQAGAGEFKAYLKLFADDAAKALDTARKTPTGGFAIDPMAMSGYGAMPPMGPPMMGPPMAGSPGWGPPMAPGMASMGGGPFSPQEFDQLRRDHEAQMKAFSDANDAFSKYLRS